ncbi:MAG: LysR family transcriptional regulator [Pseudomonadota bacterium]
MDYHQLPPLAALRAFEATARLGSFSAAARALGVTPAAVTQSVRALESHLGQALAVREGRGIALTAEGAQLADGLGDGFGAILSAVEAARADARARPVQLTMTPVFSTNWFMPRYARLRAAHPDIDLNLFPTGSVVNLAAGEAELAIRFGSGAWDGLTSTPLVTAAYIAVAAPGLIPSEGPTLEVLQGLHWLQEPDSDDIAQWMRLQGLPQPKSSRVTLMPGNMALEAARAGQGAVVTTRLFVDGDIAAGRLIPLSDDLRIGDGYHIVHRPGPLRPPVKALRSWFLQTAAEDARADRRAEQKKGRA